MTANEMKYTLLLKFDSMFEYTAPAYDDRQISYILTNAQKRVFLNKYYAPANALQKGFEADEKRRRELDQFIKSVTLNSANESASQTGIHPNGVFYDMPDDFLFAVEESVTLTAGDGETQGTMPEIMVKPVTHDAYRANIRNPYKRPYNGLVWRMDYSRLTQAVGESAATPKRTEIITDGTDVYEYRVRYLMSPPNIVVDEAVPANQVHCVLDAILHDAIIDEAIKIMNASVKPSEYNISKAENDENNKNN